MDEDSGGVINSQLVPKIKLSSGDEIPVIGLGTFGSDKYSSEQVSEALYNAAKVGYRHFDCASVYGNENLIGNVLTKLFNEGYERKDFWITSKLWNDMHDEKDVIPSFEKTLSDLNQDYLDLYLIHWPFPNHHPPGCNVDERNPNAKPYIHENYMRTWRKMEELVEKGLVRNIGTSNMTIPKLKLLLQDAKIKPVVNQMELHPHFQQKELFQFCVEESIQAVGYSPLGSPSRPERDRTISDTSDIDDPVIVEIAKKYNVHPAYVCIKWAIQRGQIPIPFSIKKSQYISNLHAAVSDPLTEKEMKAIEGIDKNCRLIKGQVFLWESAKGWEDLWDLNGEITN